MFNPHSGDVFASLDMTLYVDYLCWMDSTKQQIYVVRSQTLIEKLEIWIDSFSGEDNSSKIKAPSRFLVSGEYIWINQIIKKQKTNQI